MSTLSTWAHQERSLGTYHCTRVHLVCPIDVFICKLKRPACHAMGDSEPRCLGHLCCGNVHVSGTMSAGKSWQLAAG